MNGSRITRKGQVTIPKRILERLGLGPGDRVTFLETRRGIVLMPAKYSLWNLAGSVKPRERPEDFEKARRETKIRIARRRARK